MAKKLIMEVIWLTFNKSYQTILFQVTWLTTRARLSLKVVFPLQLRQVNLVIQIARSNLF